MSTDGGAFWTPAGVSSSLIFCSVKAMDIDNKGEVFAGTDTSGAFFSDDRGTNWSNIPSIGGKSVTSFVVNHPLMYFAGTSDHGVFISTDQGANWSSANDGLADTSVISLNVNQHGYLFAGTNEGLYKSTTAVTRLSEKRNAPYSFSLFPNYPNPFNPSTHISYQLSVASVVTLKVYNILGCLVKILAEGKQNAGIHNVTFDAAGLPSGVYFYRLTSGSLVASKKMVLIK